MSPWLPSVQPKIFPKIEHCYASFKEAPVLRLIFIYDRKILKYSMFEEFAVNVLTNQDISAQVSEQDNLHFPNHQRNSRSNQETRKQAM